MARESVINIAYVILVFISVFIESALAKDEDDYNSNYDGYYYDYYYDYDDHCDYSDYSASKPCCDWNCPLEMDMDLYTDSCYCDDMCHIFDDCCEGNSINSDKNVAMPNISFDCLYIPSIYNGWFVFIVHTCPGGTKNELQKLCTEPDEQNIYSDTHTPPHSAHVFCTGTCIVPFVMVWKISSCGKLYFGVTGNALMTLSLEISVLMSCTCETNVSYFTKNRWLIVFASATRQFPPVQKHQMR